MQGLLVAIALCYVLFKIPSWVLGSIRGGGGKSFLGSAIRGFVTYKSLGLLRAGGQSVAAWRMSRARGRGEKRPSDPYAHAETTEQGQWMLPFGPLTRTRPRGRSQATAQTETTGGTQTTRRGREADRRRSAHSGRGRTDPHGSDSGSRRSGQRSGARDSGPSGRQGWLFTSGGTTNAAAVPDRYPGGLPVRERSGDQRMLPITTAHEPNRTGRDTLADEHARREPSRQPVSPRQTAMLKRASGELDRQALPPHRRQAAVGGQQHLELETRSMPKPARARQPARSNNQPEPEPGRPVPGQPGSSPPLSRHQMPLLHRDGSPTRQSRAVPSTEPRSQATRQAREARRARAQARQQRRRGATAAVPVPEFLAPRPFSVGPTNPPPAPSPASVEDPGRGRPSSPDDEGREPADE